jgi:peptidoglycan-N-acetylmuramic acid deacetylase
MLNENIVQSGNGIQNTIQMDEKTEEIVEKEEASYSGEAEQKASNKTENTKIEVTSESYQNLSNEKCAWGFVRKSNGVRPEFYGPHAKVLDNNQGIYCGNSEEKVLYLTFDEGYENGYTGKILDTLKEKNVKAIFFITGPYLEKEKELIQRMIDEGHQVGNHTINHPSLPSLSDKKVEDEVLDLDRKFYEEFGKTMKYLRPPMGEFSERTLSITKSLGYTNVFWSFAYRDWETDNQKGKDHAYNTVINALHPGEVMLLHAVSKDNAEALGDIIDKAREMGYEFGEL